MRKMCKPCFEDFESKSHFESRCHESRCHESKSHFESKHHCKACDCEPETCKRKECHFCPKPVILECACGTGTILSNLDTCCPFNPIPLGCLTIDTTCLCKPMVKFDFCSTITLTGPGNDNAELKFRLCKTCDGGEKVCCGTWDFRANLNGNNSLSTSFNFCDCETMCPGCCIFTVEIFQAVTGTGNNNFVAISNVMLSAIAVSSC